MVISLFRAFWQQLKANLFEQVGTALLTSSDLLQAVITDLLFPVFNSIDQGRLISLLQACKRQYATGLFQQVCYSLTKWTGLLLYVNSLRQLGKINSWQQVCDISGRSCTRPSSRRLQQACCQPVVECRRQAACQMRSRGMLRPVVTCLLQTVFRSDANCCDRTAAVLLETNLLHPVVTELPQWCCEQNCSRM